MPPSSKLPTHGKHIPVLDGIRGLAIALVMFQHFFHGIDPGSALSDKVMFGLAYRSWMGVDLFFVLSGFLITGILLDAKGRDGYYYHFLMRRVLRIFPAYYTVLLIFFVILPMFSDPAIKQYLAASMPHQAYHWTYLTNFKIAAEGAWYPAHIPNVFWSLAIEEQFYLVWPFVVLLCTRRALMITCSVLFAFALGLRIVLALDPEVTWVTSFVLTPARMDGLVLGAFLATLARTEIDLIPTRKWAWIIGGVSLIPLGYLTIQRGEGWRESPEQATRFTLIALAFGSLLWLCVTTPRSKGGILSRPLTSSFMRMLGKYSYALYLWHGPMAEVTRHYFNPNSYGLFMGSRLLPTLAYSAICLVLSLVVAWLSWNLVEKHFLRLKKYFVCEPPKPARPSAVPAASAAKAARAGDARRTVG